MEIGHSMSISMLLHKHHNASQNHDSSGNLLDFFNKIQIYVTVSHPISATTAGAAGTCRLEKRFGVFEVLLQSLDHIGFHAVRI